MADMQEAMSKSAKRRAAKKARDGAEEEVEAPAPKATPSEAPKSKAKAKVQAAPAPAATTAAPKAAEPKGKAKAKAEPKAEPVAEAKAKAKAEPKAKVAVAEQPKAKEQPKAASKAKAKAKAEAPPPTKVEETPEYIQFDDGKGGDWEESSGKSKKQDKYKANKKKKEEEDAQKQIDDEEAAKKAEIEAKKQAKQAQKQAAKATAAPKAKEEEPKLEVESGNTVAPEPATTTPATTTTTAEAEKPTGPPDATAVVKIPEGKIGRVIGPGGANIRKIQEETGIKKIDTSGDTVTIIGPPAAVPLAEAAVKELIEKGYMQLAYKDFAEGGVQIYASSIPDIIGQRGAVINEIKKVTNVEIKMPDVPKGGKDGVGKGGPDATKKYKVEIVGDKEGVEKAKEIINSILMYGHHEATHPDEVHEEMDVPQECYGFIIGRGGSELRHIQNNYHVRVNIPRATSVNDKVVIVGLSSDVERTVRHINKLMMDESEKTKERAERDAKRESGEKVERAPRRKDEDDEGPMEPWMAAYMKKR